MPFHRASAPGPNWGDIFTAEIAESAEMNGVNEVPRMTSAISACSAVNERHFIAAPRANRVTVGGRDSGDSSMSFPNDLCGLLVLCGARWPNMSP